MGIKKQHAAETRDSVLNTDGVQACPLENNLPLVTNSQQKTGRLAKM